MEAIGHNKTCNLPEQLILHIIFHSYVTTSIKVIFK